MTGVLQVVAGMKSGGGGGLSASKSGDAYASGTAPPASQTLTTNTVSVTPSGGTGIYTHSWEFVSGNNVFTISDDVGSSVTWTATVGSTAKSAVWQDFVSDSSSSVVVTVTITAQVV